MPLSPNELYRKYVHPTLGTFNNGAGLHPKDTAQLSAAVCLALHDALNPPTAEPEPEPEQTPPVWSITDDNRALWQIQIIDFATDTTTTHYLLAEDDILDHEDLCKLCATRPVTLAAALALPKTIGTDYDLIGLTYLGLVNTLG